MAETTEAPKVAPATNGVQPEPKRAPQIGEGRVQGSEYARQDWVANLEDGTTLEDIMRPEFWSHNAARFQPYATIECRAEDGTWIAYLVVTGCDRTWARVALDRVLKLTTGDVAATQAAKHVAKWKGPQHKWSAIRLSDGELLKDGFLTEKDAGAWIENHEKVIA